MPNVKPRFTFSIWALPRKFFRRRVPTPIVVSPAAQPPAVQVAAPKPAPAAPVAPVKRPAATWNYGIHK